MDQRGHRVFSWLLVVFVLSISACSTILDPKPSGLIGQWTFVPGDNDNLLFACDIVFFPDGSLKALDSEILSANEVSFELLKRGKMRLGILEMTEELSYVLNGDELTLYFVDGTNHYTRGETAYVTLNTLMPAETKTISFDILPTRLYTDSPPTVTPQQEIEPTETQQLFAYSANLDRSDPMEVLNYLQDAISGKSPEAIGELIQGDTIAYWYSTISAIGDEVVETPKSSFVAEIDRRMQTPPVCEGIKYDEKNGTLMVWYKLWKPAWSIPYDVKNFWPTTAAFSFKQVNGQYNLQSFYTNPPFAYFNPDFVVQQQSFKLISCDTPSLQNPTYVPACNGSPPQRLEVGGKGYVCTSKEPVRLRTDPGTESAIILRMSPNTRFSIVDGPVCTDDHWSWWKVRIDQDRIGWAAEGGDEEDIYFLCPEE